MPWLLTASRTRWLICGVAAAVLAVPTQAAAKSAWTVIAGPSVTGFGAARGDGRSALAYVAGRRLRVLAARTLNVRSVPLPTAGCSARRMAAGATLVECGLTVGLVTASSPYRQLTSRQAADDPAGGPTDVFGLGMQWLAVYNAGSLLSQTYVDFVNWHTGAVIRDPTFPRDLRFDLDGAVPREASPCTPGAIMDHRGDRWLMLRRTNSGGAVYLTVCGPRPTSVRLGRTRANTTNTSSVTGQLSTAFATWTDEDRVTVVRLPSRRTFTWTLRTAPSQSEPALTVGQAGNRLLLGVTRASGKHVIQTTTIPK